MQLRKTLMSGWSQELQSNWSKRSCTAASRLQIDFDSASGIGQSSFFEDTKTDKPRLQGVYSSIRSEVL